MSEGPAQAFTHVVPSETEYYLDGPEQARGPDGSLEAGTKVALLEEAGSYCQVRTEGGIEAYISRESLQPLREERGL
jgi:hypothetical protein